MVAIFGKVVGIQNVILCSELSGAGEGRRKS